MGKKLIIINGPSGVGKTTVCWGLYKEFEKSVWLDGDWCWMMNPFKVNEENLKMAEDNIAYMLKNFIENLNYEYVILGWIIFNNQMFDRVLRKLKDKDYKLYKITLLCSEEKLRERMILDHREAGNIETSVHSIKYYKPLDTNKLDTTNLTADEVVHEIVDMVNNNIIGKGTAPN